MRRRYGKPVRDRDTRITVTIPTIIYDDDGKEMPDSTSTIEFWGKVLDSNEVGAISAFKRLDADSIAIEADTEAIEAVGIIGTLTTDKDDKSYEIVSKFDSQWKFTSMIIAKYKN